MFTLVDLPTSTIAIAILTLSFSCICLVCLAHLITNSRKYSYLPQSTLLGKEKAGVSNSNQPSYEAVFPPSQRQTLTELGPKFNGTKAVDLSTLPKSSLVKLKDDYRSAKPTHYIFSGFKVHEIRRLGSFPDYATLSGVPLPAPLKSFNIDKAVPRPYRPFRWPYHQTMCK